MSLGAPDRRRTTGPTASRAAVAEHGRTRRDQPWRGRRRAVSTDRSPAGTSTVHGVAGAGQERRPTPLSGPGRRRRRVPAGPTAQACEAGGGAAVAGGGGGQAGAAVVAATDRRVAAPGLPSGSGDAGVARDHLPVAVRAEPRALRRELQRCLRTGRAMRYHEPSACPRAAASSATSC